MYLEISINKGISLLKHIFIASKSNTKDSSMLSQENLSPQKIITPTKFTFPPVIETTDEFELPQDSIPKPEELERPKLSPTSMSLLEAAANVASSLDEAVDAVIQSSPRAKRKQFLKPLEPKEVLSVMQRSYNCEEVSPGDDEKTHLIDSSWDEECHKHLTDFADKLSEKLLQEIDQYQEANRRQEQKEVKFLSSSSYQHIDDPYIHRLSEELEDLNKLSAEIQKQNEFLSKLSKNDFVRIRSNKNDLMSCILCNKNKCKCLRIHSGVSDNEKVPQKIASNSAEISDSCVEQGTVILKNIPNRLNETYDTNLDLTNSTSTSSLLAKNLRLSRESSDASDILDKAPSDIKNSSSVATSLHFGHSIDSNDTVDLSERTTASGSDSQKDTNSVSRFSDGDSTASLKSCSELNHIITKSRLAEERSSSEEAATQGRMRDDISIDEQILAENYGSVNTSLSDDTSQDSLPSDNIGGAITYHRYYHVFREGELDQLIERYVENLHIISSYYDHASWCVVAEKVQVWTI